MQDRIVNIPLSQLERSPLNMRKTAKLADIPQLAADIQAKGLLENLVVHKLDGKRKRYGVVAGGRRFAALKRLAGQGKIATDFPVPCLVKQADEAALTEISLSENFQHVPPHPVDQFEAFAKLVGDGLKPSGIASRFGITKTFVEQRLKLAAVSPRLLADYRKDRMTLEHVMAFTVTNDHALQEEVWFDQPYGKIDPSFIRRRLTRSQVEATDRRALFIGVKAYEAAGGILRRDLFDQENEGYFTDSQLLDRLVAEKLETIAEEYRKQGWSWVEVLPETDFGQLARFSHAAPGEASLPKKDEKRLTSLSTRYDDLVARAEADEDPAIVAELDAIEAELKSLQARKEVWSDADKARSGVTLSLDSDGAVNIARGIVREERTEDTAKPKRMRSGYPESVLRDLGAHRTAALRECLAASPAIAELALLQALVSMSFHAGRAGCVEITAREVSFEHLSDSVGESPAAMAFFTRRQKWASKLPEPEGLWSWLRTLDAKARKDLMGLCVAMTVNALHGNEDAASPLASVLNLDMRSWWKPSDVMLGRLSKADILAAVTQAVSSEAARKLSDLKKPVIAERAAKLLGEAGWLPEALRVENPTAELAAE